VPIGDAISVERGQIRRYRRQYHLFHEEAPSDDEWLEWVALMQHYGAPSRILDWSYSIFSALFFAVESAEPCGSVIWAVNSNALAEPFARKLQGYPDVLDAWNKDRSFQRVETITAVFLSSTPIPLVGSVTPQRTNLRLDPQRGTFLCPGDISQGFDSNFSAMLMTMERSYVMENFKRIVISIDGTERKAILNRLHEMNITCATLFPGIEGFSRSIRHMIANYQQLLSPGDLTES
jgi:hypothetical protein